MDVQVQGVKEGGRVCMISIKKQAPEPIPV